MPTPPTRQLFPLAVILGLLSTTALAASELNVVVDGVEGEALDNINAFLSIREAETDPPPDSRIRWLHRQASEEIRRALEPLGYYDVDVNAQLLDDGEVWTARYSVSLGEPVIVDAVTLSIDGEGRNDPRFQAVVADPGLAVGEPFRHAQYEALKQRLRALALERGYFDARFTESRAIVDLADGSVRVALTYDSGHRYRFGEVSFTGGVLDESLLRRYVQLEPGEPYRADKLIGLQSDLVASNYFDNVLLDADPDAAEDDQIPVMVELAMRPQTRYSIGMGYGTDTGVRGKADWERRWLNRYGHKARAGLLASQIEQSLTGEYIVPGADPRTDDYTWRLGLKREDSDNKESITALAGVHWTRRLAPWTRTLGLEYRWEEFTVSDQTEQIGLLIPSATWQLVEADDPLFITRGYRLEVGTRGAYELLLSDVSFIQAWAKAKWVQPLWTDGRLLVRGDLGGTWMFEDQNDFSRLPTSLRYYAGGDTSIRGYSLDSVAPRDAEGRVVGGKHLMVGSIEYEHTVVDNWSVAAFVDAGDAFDDEAPELKLGAGFGLRWASPVGPVRIDLAHGFDEPGDDIRLHLTIGPDL